MRKELSHVMLELHNVRMEPSSMKKKLREPLNVTKELSYVETAQCEDRTVKCEKKVRKPPNVRKKLSYVMLKLHNMRTEPSNVRKKNCHM